ncbi:MAG: adenylate/guanylate cyclase domain-containing protein [Coleofasciculaceae cyanobacterium]
MPETWKRLLWEWRGVWVTAPSMAILVILVRTLGLLQSFEWAAFDQYLRLRPAEPQDERIVIVGINEADLQNISQPIISDAVYAQLLEKLKAKKPRAIGLDIYRDLPVEPGHQDLVKIFNSTPNLIGIEKVVGDSRREAIPAPPALKAKGQVGANDLILDADNKVRRGLLYVQAPNGEQVFSLGFYAALLYLNKQKIEPQVEAGTKNWRLGKAKFLPFEANDGGYVQADDRGFQLLLNYRGGSRHFSTVSLTDVLKDRLPANWGRDRIILIGGVGESFPDLHFTPYSSSRLSLPVRMAGVEIHATLASQVISSALEGRTLIKSWSEPFDWLWIILWSTIGSFLSWQNRYTNGVNRFSLNRVNFTLFAGVFLVGSTYWAFLNGWWIPVIPAILGLVSSTITINAYVARTARKIRKTFGRYLTDEVVANLLENPQGLKLGGERREITILTSDLRGFTNFSERFPPEEVVKILNFYLGCMADVITQYQGTIDEFMGDGILVLFGAPTIRENDAERAVACSIAMQLAMETVNKKMAEWNLPNLNMGIGINTGEVIVGNIGSDKRSKYGVVGSQVNLTYRIESYTVGGQILISESTLKAVESIARIDGEKQVKPKGVLQEITLYEVGGITGNYHLFLSSEVEKFLPIPEEKKLQCYYTILDGKHLNNSLFRGSLIRLSARGAEISHNGESQAIPEPMSNLKLNLLTDNSSTQVSGDIYGKVLDLSNGSFYIHFTAKPPEVERLFNTLYKSLKDEINEL